MAMNVFVSSTFGDLEAHRAAVIDMLHQTNNLPLAMETFGSKPGDAETVSLDEVRKADLFIGIYGNRYGYRPDDDKSVTELEYLEAVKNDIPRLVFIVEEEYTDPASPINQHAETDEEGIMLLNIFKRKLNRENVRATFNTPQDLVQKVQNAIMNWLQDKLDAAEQTSQSSPTGSTTQINADKIGNVFSGPVSGPINIDQSGFFDDDDD